MAGESMARLWGGGAAPELKGREETRRGRAGAETPSVEVVASQGCLRASSVSENVSSVAGAGEKRDVRTDILFAGSTMRRRSRKLMAASFLVSERLG